MTMTIDVLTLFVESLTRPGRNHFGRHFMHQNLFSLYSVCKKTLSETFEARNVNFISTVTLSFSVINICIVHYS